MYGKTKEKLKNVNKEIKRLTKEYRQQKFLLNKVKKHIKEMKKKPTLNVYTMLNKLGEFLSLVLCGEITKRFFRKFGKFT